jgi:3-deoxy-D-manno-octulosonic-acid transferase
LPRILYKIFVFVYSRGIELYALVNSKAALWVSGRRNLFENISAQLQNDKSPIIWMHCASLGEFEQGKPLIETIKEKNGPHKIVLTFFSPSGYENVKNYSGVDYVFYLPIDSPSNAKKFLDIVHPDLVLWVKYEYWYYFLSELNTRNIPTLLISGIFRNGQPFFKWYGKIWKEMLNCFSHFFVQNEHSKNLLNSIGFNKNVTINGDTRFDRVIQLSKNFTPIPLIETFCGDSIVFVAGSTWEEDEAELSHFVKSNPNIKFIIAPHEIDKGNLNDVRESFPHAVLFSEFEKNISLNSKTNCLIIDNIGMLSRLYKYADITYVGGGFGDDGIHNILEPAVYGKPVFFGPVYDKYIEAEELIEQGGAFTIDNALELEQEINSLLQDKDKLTQCGVAAKNYVFQKEGPTKKIVNYIYENRLLTN